MIGEVIPDVSSVQGWMQIGSSLGFAGLSWYLITVANPKAQERADANIKILQERFDVHAQNHLTEFRTQLETLSNQLKFVVERHEATVEIIIMAQEKQIDRILQQFKG